MKTKTTHFEGETHRNQKKSFADELLDKKETFKKKVMDKNLQLKNLLKTNLELLKINDINTMLLF